MSTSTTQYLYLYTPVSNKRTQGFWRSGWFPAKVWNTADEPRASWGPENRNMLQKKGESVKKDHRNYEGDKGWNSLSHKINNIRIEF